MSFVSTILVLPIGTNTKGKKMMNVEKSIIIKKSLVSDRSICRNFSRISLKKNIIIILLDKIWRVTKGFQSYIKIYFRRVKAFYHDSA